jgi:hypothetical protein
LPGSVRKSSGNRRGRRHYGGRRVQRLHRCEETIPVASDGFYVPWVLGGIRKRSPQSANESATVPKTFHFSKLNKAQILMAMYWYWHMRQICPCAISSWFQVFLLHLSSLAFFPLQALDTLQLAWQVYELLQY